MASSSTPSSSPAIGRISTWSSRRSRQANSRSASSLLSRSARGANAQRSTLNAQRSMERVERCRLSVERWTFSLSRRVKGAWWPSRSSKPSLVGNGRGRFDSYPLRHFTFDGRCLMFDFKVTASLTQQTSDIKPQTFQRGGERDVARADS